MSFRNPKSNGLPDCNPVKWKSQRPAPKLTALALMLLGGILIPVAVPGLGKDKKPQARTVSGTVFDEAENPIQGATVELADLQTGKVLDSYSQEGGQYQFTELRFDHDYTVKAMFKGASSEARKVSMFEMRTRLVLNLTLSKTNK